MNVKDDEKKFKIELPLVIDAGIFLALGGIVFWAGGQGTKIQEISTQLTAIQTQVQALNNSSTTVEVARVKAVNDAQDIRLEDLKHEVINRLDRIENKLDKEQSHGRR